MFRAENISPDKKKNWRPGAGVVIHGALVRSQQPRPPDAASMVGLISSFCRSAVIAGKVRALEIMEQAPQLDTLLVP